MSFGMEHIKCHLILPSFENRKVESILYFDYEKF